MIHKLIPGSRLLCIGSAGSGLGGRLASSSGLGGSGFGLGVGDVGDDGGRGGNLERLLLKVRYDGVFSFILEIFQTTKSSFAGIDESGPMRL